MGYCHGSGICSPNAKPRCGSIMLLREKISSKALRSLFRTIEAVNALHIHYIVTGMGVWQNRSRCRCYRVEELAESYSS